ncbi:MAG TPA: hypothetical protein VN213_07800 [Solirubrobacteraceae bacterium]|nr:hypothetical protein [Solirubrobacteraceae bacterium]
MPVKKRKVGRARVGGQIGGLGVGPGRIPETPGTRFPSPGGTTKPGWVNFWSDDLNISFDCLLNTDGGRVTGGGPQYDESPRVLRTDVPQYRSTSPLRMSISILLEGWPDTDVRPWISHFDELQVILPRLQRPPTLHIRGSVPYRNKAWLLDGAPVWDTDPTPVRNEAGVLVRQPLTVNLIEFVKDDQLEWSVARSRRNGRGEGQRETKVRKGENDLGDVSKRVYGTRNRAVEIARLNNLPYGARLKPGRKLRLP